MAVDDVIPIIYANLVDGATFDRQPGSGVEEMLLDMGQHLLEGSAPNKVPGIQVLMVDGTNNGSQIQNGDGGGSALVWFRAKPMATNSVFFRFGNTSGATGDAHETTIVVG